MRVRHFLLFALAALAGCGGEPDPEPEEHVRPRDPAPKVVRHAVNHLAGSAAAEVEVANAGGAGPVRVRVDQGEKRWEQRFPFAEREQRTVSLALPGAGGEYFMVSAHGESVPWVPRPAPPKKPWFGLQLFDDIIYGGVLGLIAGSVVFAGRELVRVFRRFRPGTGTPADSARAPPHADDAGCSVCGKRLTKTQRGLGLCAPLPEKGGRLVRGRRIPKENRCGRRRGRVN